MSLIEWRDCFQALMTNTQAVGDSDNILLVLFQRACEHQIRSLVASLLYELQHVFVCHP